MRDRTVWMTLCKEAADVVGTTEDLDAVTSACLKAGELIKVHGSTELQQAMRIVLFIIGREIAAQHVGHHNSHHDVAPHSARRTS